MRFRNVANWFEHVMKKGSGTGDLVHWDSAGSRALRHAFQLVAPGLTVSIMHTILWTGTLPTPPPVVSLTKALIHFKMNGGGFLLG